MRVRVDEHEAYLPRTTERPARECGDECCELPWGAAPQSRGRKSVVRGLLLRPSKSPPASGRRRASRPPALAEQNQLRFLSHGRCRVDGLCQGVGPLHRVAPLNRFEPALDVRKVI